MRKIIITLFLILISCLSVSLFACWENTVTFLADGVEVAKVSFSSNVEIIETPEVPEKEGYRGYWEEFVLADKDIVVKARYELIEYKIFFVDENEKPVGEVEYTVLEPEITEPNVPEKNHYNGKWENYEKGFKEKTKTVRPVYTPIEYCITFKADGFSDVVKTYTIENFIFFSSPAVPEKEGYTCRWTSYDLEFNTTQVVNASFIKNEDMKFYVSFYSGTKLIKTVTLNYGDTEIPAGEVPAVPQKEYYKDGVWEDYVLENKSINVYAKYTPIRYSVKFVDENGEQVGEIQYYTVEDGTTVEVPDVPEKKGYISRWEVYALNGGDKIVKPIYVLEGKIIIKFDTSIIYLPNGTSVSVNHSPCENVLVADGEKLILPELGDFTSVKGKTSKDYKNLKWVFVNTKGEIIEVKSGATFNEADFRSNPDVAVTEITLHMQTASEPEIWVGPY